MASACVVQPVQSTVLLKTGPDLSVKLISVPEKQENHEQDKENHPNLPRGLACFPLKESLRTSSDSQSINRLSYQVMRPLILKATLRCYLQMIPALKVTVDI